MIPNLLIAAGLEAHARWIAEPFVPRRVTREEHLQTVRAFVRAVHIYNRSTSP